MNSKDEVINYIRERVLRIVANTDEQMDTKAQVLCILDEYQSEKIRRGCVECGNVE